MCVCWNGLEAVVVRLVQQWTSAEGQVLVVQSTKLNVSPAAWGWSVTGIISLHGNPEETIYNTGEEMLW